MSQASSPYILERISDFVGSDVRKPGKLTLHIGEERRFSRVGKQNLTTDQETDQETDTNYMEEMKI